MKILRLILEAKISNKLAENLIKEGIQEMKEPVLTIRNKKAYLVEAETGPYKQK